MTDQVKYVVKPLEDEDRAAFQCGEDSLDRYFRERASRDRDNRLSAVFIVVPQDDPKTIVGFFTLSSQRIACEKLPEELRKKTGKYSSVGATLLGRMAVAKDFQNRRLGRFVLFAALYEAWKATKHVSSFAVIVDAKTEHVITFYEKYGFRRLEGKRLVLPMKTIEETVAKPAAASAAKASTTATAEEEKAADAPRTARTSPEMPEPSS